MSRAVAGHSEAGSGKVMGCFPAQSEFAPA